MTPGVADLCAHTMAQPLVRDELQRIIVAQSIRNRVVDIGDIWVDGKQGTPRVQRGGAWYRLVNIVGIVDTTAEITDTIQLQDHVEFRYFILRAQIELLSIGRSKVGRDRGLVPGRVVSQREVDGWKDRKSLAHCRSRCNITGRDAACQTKRNVPGKTHVERFTTRCVVEKTKAAAKHGIRQHLIGKADARSPVLAERQDTCSQTHSVPSGNIHFSSNRIEVRPAVQFLTGRTEVIPAQAIVQRQLPRHSPVIRNVYAILVEANARKGKGVVMPDGCGISEHHAGSTVSTAACRVSGVR